jgi:hypothetical protein
MLLLEAVVSLSGSLVRQIDGSTGCCGNLMAVRGLLRFSGSGSLKTIVGYPTETGTGGEVKFNGRLGTSWIGNGRKGALWWAIWGKGITGVGREGAADGQGGAMLGIVLPRLSKAWTACFVVDWSCKHKF